MAEQTAIYAFQLYGLFRSLLPCHNYSQLHQGCEDEFRAYLNAADEYQLEEHDGVERRLAGVAVEALGLGIEKASVEQLGQSTAEILLRYALRQAEAQHDFIDELLVALHTYEVPLASHLLLQQPQQFCEWLTSPKVTEQCSPLLAACTTSISALLV